MKILMLSEDFLPNVGGITSHIVYLSKALVERGHTVLILKPSQNSDREWEHEFGFKVIELKKRFFNKIFIYNKIRKLSKGFDIVHWHQLGGYETKFLSIGKVFTNHTSMYLEQYEKQIGRLNLKIMLAHADAVISPSRELEYKSKIIKPAIGNFYISNGIDTTKFFPSITIDKAFQYKDLLSNKKIILCPRRLEPKCGVKYFIESIPYIQTSLTQTSLTQTSLYQTDDLTFVIAGCGGFIKEEESMKDWLRERGLLEKVIFLGDVENNVMPQLYQLSEIVVFPSLMEATSISCLEAMASAKAIVSTNVGGLTELLHDGVDGLLVNPRDSMAIADKIKLLCSDKDLRIRLGNNARKRVEEFYTWKIIAEKTERVYKNVLGEDANINC